MCQKKARALRVSFLEEKIWYCRNTRWKLSKAMPNKYVIWMLSTGKVNIKAIICYNIETWFRKETILLGGKK